MGFQLDAAILPARQTNLNADKAEAVNRSQSSQSREPSDFHKILGKENNRSQDSSLKAHSHDNTSDKDASSVQSKEQALEGHESSWHEEGADNSEFSITDNVSLHGEEQTSEEGIDGVLIDSNILSSFDDTTNETNTLDFVFNRLGFLSNESTLQNKDQQNMTSSFALSAGVDGQEKPLSFIVDESLTDGISDLDSIDEVTAQMNAEMKKTVLANGISLASVIDSNVKNKVSAVGIQGFIDEGIIGEKLSNKSILGESTNTNSIALPNEKNGSLFDTLLSGKASTNNNAFISTGNILADTTQESLIAAQEVTDDTAQTTLISKLGSPDIMMSPNGRVQVPVNIAFGQPQWANAIADRTAMLASQNINFAELQLDPPELGPLTVKIHINQDQAVVNFVAHSPLVKDSLEQNSQRLKDMFNEQGLNLADVDVSERQSGDQENASNDGQDSADTLGHDDVDMDDNLNSMTVSHQIGIDTGVDDFA